MLTRISKVRQDELGLGQSLAVRHNGVAETSNAFCVSNGYRDLPYMSFLGGLNLHFEACNVEARDSDFIKQLSRLLTTDSRYSGTPSTSARPDLFYRHHK